MTTPAKKYQNVSYRELLSFSEHNPNRHRVLESIEVPTSLSDSSLDSLYLKGYTSLHLNPAGILSVISCISDPALYSLSPEHTRIEQLIELSTSLQQQTDGLKNTSLMRKRKKLHDLLQQYTMEAESKRKITLICITAYPLCVKHSLFY
jgi:hypothetical protein